MENMQPSYFTQRSRRSFVKMLYTVCGFSEMSFKFFWLRKAYPLRVFQKVD